MDPYQKKKPTRWSDDEVKLLINYIQTEEQGFEKHTSHYYRKFIHIHSLPMNSEGVRSKVRYLKDNYIKAEKWRQGPIAEVMRIDGDIQGIQFILEKMCPHYEDLRKIYGDIKIVENQPDEDPKVENELFSASESSFMDEDPLEKTQPALTLNCESSAFEKHIALQKLQLRKDKLELKRLKVLNRFKLEVKRIESAERVKVLELKLKYQKDKATNPTVE